MELERNTISWDERSADITELAKALSKFQAAIEPVKKDSANPFFKSKYADLSSIWDAIRAPLAKEGLSILQEPSAHDGKITITTILLHASGQYIRSALTLPVVKQDPQGYGSAITYGRRYALQSIAGVAPEDDDGNAASGKEMNGVAKPPIGARNVAPRPGTLGVGKYKDTPLTEVPVDYLQKVFEDRRGPWELAEQELLRREAVQMQQQGAA